MSSKGVLVASITRRLEVGQETESHTITAPNGRTYHLMNGIPWKCTVPILAQSRSTFAVARI